MNLIISCSFWFLESPEDLTSQVVSQEPDSPKGQD